MANGRASLDPRWTKHHQPVVRGFMTATVSITRRDNTKDVTYNRETRQYEGADGAYVTIYEGPARVQPYGLNFNVEVGLDPTSRKLVNIQIDEQALDVQPDDTVLVTACADAPLLETYQFDARSAVPSSIGWGTSVIAEVNARHG